MTSIKSLASDLRECLRRGGGKRRRQRGWRTLGEQGPLNLLFRVHVNSQRTKQQRGPT